MIDKESGITLVRYNEGLEKVSLKGLDLTLLASGDGTEIIHHRLSAGSHWAMVPADGWTALESFLVLSGKLLWTHSQGKTLLTAGDSISANPSVRSLSSWQRPTQNSSTYPHNRYFTITAQIFKK